MTSSESNDPVRVRNQLTFSLRETIYLVAAASAWLAFLTQQFGFRPQGMIMLTVCAVFAGVSGHFVHRLLWEWRLTVCLTSLLLYGGVAFLILAVSGQADILQAVFTPAEALAAPVTDLFAESRFLKIHQLAIGVVATLILLPAHVVKPRLINAIFTSMGVAAWYSMGFLICLSRYFGA